MHTYTHTHILPSLPFPAPCPLNPLIPAPFCPLPSALCPAHADALHADAHRPWYALLQIERIATSEPGEDGLPCAPQMELLNLDIRLAAAATQGEASQAAAANKKLTKAEISLLLPTLLMEGWLSSCPGRPSHYCIGVSGRAECVDSGAGGSGLVLWVWACARWPGMGAVHN